MTEAGIIDAVVENLGQQPCRSRGEVQILYYTIDTANNDANPTWTARAPQNGWTVNHSTILGSFHQSCTACSVILFAT